MSKDFTRKINYKKKTLKLYGLSMFNRTPSVYNDKKITFNLGIIRL